MIPEIKRNDYMSLADFLSADGNIPAELRGQVHGLTENRMPNGTITYSGVLTDVNTSSTTAVHFRGGCGINTANQTIDDQIVKSTLEMAALRYSTETGNPVYLGVFKGSKSHIPQANVSYVSIHSAPNQE